MMQPATEHAHVRGARGGGGPSSSYSGSGSSGSQWQQQSGSMQWQQLRAAVHGSISSSSCVMGVNLSRAMISFTSVVERDQEPAGTAAQPRRRRQEPAAGL